MYHSLKVRIYNTVLQLIVVVLLLKRICRKTVRVRFCFFIRIFCCFWWDIEALSVLVLISQTLCILFYLCACLQGHLKGVLKEFCWSHATSADVIFSFHVRNNPQAARKINIPRSSSDPKSLIELLASHEQQ